MRDPEGQSRRLIKVQADFARHLQDSLRSSAITLVGPATQALANAAALDIAKATRVFALATQSWAKQVQPVLESFRAFARAFTEALPENWSGFSATQVAEVVRIGESRVWNLVWVPRQEVVLEVLRAVDDSHRQELILAARSDVVTDLRLALTSVSFPGLATEVDGMTEAVDAFDAGFTRASQSLAAVAVTHMVEQHLEASMWKVREDFADVGALDLTGPMSEFRFSCLLCVLGRALRRFRRGYEEADAALFNRHASVHTLSPAQFTDMNALAGLLLGTALLRELDIRLKREAGPPSAKVDGTEPAATHTPAPTRDHRLGLKP